MNHKPSSTTYQIIYKQVRRGQGRNWRIQELRIDSRAQRCNVYVPPEASGKLVTVRSGRSLSLREAAEFVAAKSGLECRIKQCPVGGSIAHGGLYSVTFYTLEDGHGY